MFVISFGFFLPFHGMGEYFISTETVAGWVNLSKVKLFFYWKKFMSLRDLCDVDQICSFYLPHQGLPHPTYTAWKEVKKARNYFQDNEICNHLPSSFSNILVQELILDGFSIEAAKVGRKFALNLAIDPFTRKLPELFLALSLKLEFNHL